MALSRRRFVAAGLGVAVSAGPLRRAGAQGAATRELRLTGTVVAGGTYLELPFEVPAGVARVDVRTPPSTRALKTGLGLFDERGSGYQSAGFRGVYGEERHEAFVSARAASESFLAGPVRPGTWTVLVPVFSVERATPITATVTLTFGPQGATSPPGAAPDVVRVEPGWWKGDLHCHTPASSDAWRSRSARDPRGWADAARSAGVHFLSMTDHNVVTQNLDLLGASGGDVLLLPGEEVTNWAHGHATVSGIDVGAWLDWRQSPGGATSGPGTASGDGTLFGSGRDGARIRDLLRFAREMDVYVAAAHPMGVNLRWAFLEEAAADPASRTDGFEVWTGPWQPDDEAALQAWDQMLVAGQRVTANGGSDLHGWDNDDGFRFGTPTTVVWAPRLARADVLDGLRRGRAYVTRRPDGVELGLRVVHPDGQAEQLGGTVWGDDGDEVEVQVHVRRAGGMRLQLVAGGAPLGGPATIASDDEVVRVPLRVGSAGYVRAEVRGESRIVPQNLKESELDMEALTNPVFLAVGDRPGDAEPFDPPPFGSSRLAGPGGPGAAGDGTPWLLPAAVGASAALAAGGVVAASRRRRR